MSVTWSPKPNHSNRVVISTAETGVPTLFACYVRGKGKRTYVREVLSPNWSDAFNARHVARRAGGDALEIRFDAAVGDQAPTSFPSTERDEFERRAKSVRAESRMADVMAVIDKIPAATDIDCGMDDGFALALRRAWDERRPNDGRSSLMTEFELFAGKPERYIFRAWGR